MVSLSARSSCCRRATSISRTRPCIADKLVFTYKEVVEALIKQHGLHEGVWSIYMEFGISGGNAGPSEDMMMPTAIVPIIKIGLIRVEKESVFRRRCEGEPSGRQHLERLIALILVVLAPEVAASAQKVSCMDVPGQERPYAAIPAMPRTVKLQPVNSGRILLGPPC